MIISVASGKGGTGKTTVATNLAAAMDIPIQLLDCDVEEPNAHIFIKPVIHDKRTVYTMVPEVDSEKCTGCGDCVKICRFSALTAIGGKVITFADLCHGCGGCVEVCTDGAITEGHREVGIVESGNSGLIAFEMGKMRIGEPAAPPLIRKVREKITPEGDTIIDAPPGTSCPVISAIEGTDYVILVTEPTPFGLHDLKLAVEVVKEIAIPCGIVINRSDLGDDKVHEYASNEGIPILMEIPFSRDVASAYSRGEMLITSGDNGAEWRQMFQSLFRKIHILAEC